MKKPAILGGKPEFEKPVAFNQPTLPEFNNKIAERYKEIFKSGMITNAKYVGEFEKTAKDYLKAGNAAAVSSCTAGLMLAIKALGLQGKVIMPSFTFIAGAHALLWNNLEPVFVDIDAETYLIDAEKVKEAITEDVSAILAVHIFGQPAEVDKLQKIADAHGLKLLYDSAHAFGAEVNGKKVGCFGDAEIFSCSPTKVITSGEGGLVTTGNAELCEKIKKGRNYGIEANYECEFLGMNARLSELNAILGIETIKTVDENIKSREGVINYYKKLLKKVPGISFQKIRENVKSTFKDFALYIDSREFGMDRNVLVKALNAENIPTKTYYFPAVHQTKIYSKYFNLYNEKLPVTNRVAANTMNLPVYSHMNKETIEKIAAAVECAHENSSEISKSIKK